MDQYDLFVGSVVGRIRTLIILVHIRVVYWISGFNRF